MESRKRKHVTGAVIYHPAASTASFVEPNGMALQTLLAELNWLPSQLPFFTAAHVLPLTASCLFAKSGSTCCTLSFTTTTRKEIF